MSDTAAAPARARPAEPQRRSPSRSSRRPALSLGRLFELGLERVETTGDAGAGAVEEGAVVSLDHPHARPHDAGEARRSSRRRRGRFEANVERRS